MGEDTGRRKKRRKREGEKEFPIFLNQLKWTLITDKIVRENNIQVKPDEIQGFCQATIVWLYEYGDGLAMTNPG